MQSHKTDRKNNDVFSCYKSAFTKSTRTHKMKVTQASRPMSLRCFHERVTKTLKNEGPVIADGRDEAAVHLPDPI